VTQHYGPALRRALVVGVVAAMPGLCCGVAYASPSEPDIGPGSTDAAAVECVQSALVSAARNGKIRGYSAASVDGKYGPATVRFVKMYQKKLGLADDGIVGPKTGSHLYQEMQAEQDQVGPAQLVRCYDRLPVTGDVKGPVV
jgi:peptidoglycan hydrolase-like protein with peptidoglycan-binding domain